MIAEKADLVLHDGLVSGHPQSDAVAIGNARILTHGRFADLKGLIGPRTRLIRLAGNAVAPGFIDCHLHFMESAAVAAGVNVQRCRTIAELLTDLRTGAARTPPGNWLKAFGCDEALIAERRGPTREELDHSTPKNPLRLRHQTLHASWLNSRAITSLGLEHRDFRPPDGAILLRDSAGRLSGMVVGMEEWISARMPRVTAAELESRARTFSRELAAAGITAFTDATVRNTIEDVELFGRLVASGSISQRVAIMVGPQVIDDAYSVQRAAQNGGVRLAGIKFIGVTHWDPPRLVKAVAAALSQDLDCAFHCTEVEELAAALSAIAAARERVNDHALNVPQCRIEHGGLIPPGYPEQIAELDAWVVTNPGFVYYRGAKYAGEPGLLEYLYPARSLAAAGVRLAAGSDAPVTPAKPLYAIASAMARVSVEGYEVGLEQRIEGAAACELFTSSAASLSRLPAGRIAAGSLADLIVMAGDPATLGPADLMKLQVDLTIVGGRVIFEHGRPAMARSA